MIGALAEVRSAPIPLDGVELGDLWSTPVGKLVVIGYRERSGMVVIRRQEGWQILPLDDLRFLVRQGTLLGRAPASSGEPCASAKQVQL